MSQSTLPTTNVRVNRTERKTSRLSGLLNRIRENQSNHATSSNYVKKLNKFR